MARWVRSLLTVSVLVLALFAGLVGVSQLKFASELSDSINGRLEVVAASAARDLTSAVDLGLALDEVANGRAILRRAARHDPVIRGMYVVDTSGVIIHAYGAVPGQPDAATAESLRLAVAGIADPVWHTEGDGLIRSGTLILGSIGRPIGAVIVEYPATELTDQTRAMAGRLIGIGLLIGVVVVGAVSVTLALIRRRHDSTEASGSRSVERLVAAVLSVGILGGVVAFGLLAVPAFNEALAPELERRAELIGVTISDDTERALAIGIPFDELVGFPEYFEAFFEEFPEVNRLAVVSTDAATRYEAEKPQPSGDALGADDSTFYQYSIRSELSAEGTVVVGVDSGYINARLRDLTLDVIVILLVALVIVSEFSRAATGILVNETTATDALGPDEALRRITRLRVVLFVFVVGEELNKSFLPLFIESADNPIPWISTSVAISLPIAAYLLAIAIASPFSGRLIERFGQRGLFLIGLTPAALSHFGMAFADSVPQIIVLRGLTGAGYALATIACMEYILDTVPRSKRGMGIGAFVAVVIGGTFAGTALGGIIADRLGYSRVFLISFGLVVVAGLLALRYLRTTKAVSEGEAPRMTMKDLGAVLRQPSLVLLMAGVTIPMNVLMAAFLWYLVPLSLGSLGSTAAAIARTLMVYYLVILFGSPLVARVSARTSSNWLLAGVGTIASGAVLLIPASTLTTVTVAAAVFVVGVGHAAVRGPQIELALDLSERHFTGAGREPVLAAMRSLERIGSLVGLLGVAVAVSRFDLTVAMGAVGVLTALAGGAYMVLRRPMAKGGLRA